MVFSITLILTYIFDYHRERIYTPRDEDDDENCKTEQRYAAASTERGTLQSPPGPGYSLTALNGSVQVDCSNYNLLKSASMNCSKWVD